MITLLENSISAYAREMSLHRYGRERQTQTLLSMIGALGERAGYEVAYTDPGGKRSEWLYDLVWLDFEKTGQHRLQGVALALESEWNSEYREIMRDFNKLLQSRAKIKVMVCSGSQTGLANSLKSAVACYPGLEKCTYLIVICDFENQAHPVSFTVCDESGQDGSSRRAKAVEDYLMLVRDETSDERFSLAFEGFWPNKRDGFLSGKRGFYFVFAGTRKQTEAGSVAVLHRLIYIGHVTDVRALASQTPNDFERCCRPGEIPYYAFAEVSAGNMDHCLAALVYKYNPPMNTLRAEPSKPQASIGITMVGDVASCLGARTFRV